MPRLRPLPPPETEAVEQLPLNVLVRDWPELLPLLVRSGVDLSADGGLSLAVRDPGSPRPTPLALVAATAWREVPPPEAEG